MLEHSSYSADPGLWENEYEPQLDTIYPAASTCVSHAVQDMTVDCVPVPVQDMTVDCVPYLGTVLGNVPLVCGSVLYTQSENISNRLTRILDRLTCTVDCVPYVGTVHNLMSYLVLAQAHNLPSHLVLRVGRYFIPSPRIFRIG